MLTCQDGFNPFIHTTGVRLSRTCAGGGNWGRWFQQGLPRAGRSCRGEVDYIFRGEARVVPLHRAVDNTTIPSRMWWLQKKKGNNSWPYGSV